VVDCGSSGTTITPVVDGYELKRASIFTPVGGNLIDRHLSEYLLSRQVMVNPLGSIYGKTAPPLDPSFYHPNSLSFSASHPLLKNVKKSFLDLHYFDLVRDIKHWMAFIPHYRLAPEFRSDEGMLQAGIYMPPFYELPDGKQVASSYRLSITPELLFFPEKGPQNLSYPRPGSEGMSTTSSADSVLGKRARELIEIDRENSPSSAGFSITEESLSDLVYLAISRVDVDARKDLLSNIVLTGGTSLLGGLTQRLTKELTDITPTHLKVIDYCSRVVNFLSLCSSFAAGESYCQSSDRTTARHMDWWVGSCYLRYFPPDVDK
jgi:actin-related protein